MIKSPFCGAYKIIILGHNHLCLTVFIFLKLKTPENLISGILTYRFKKPIVDIKSINKNSANITVALKNPYL